MCSQHGSPVNEPLELLLLSQQLEEVEEEGDVVVFAPDVLVMPVGPLLLLSSQLVLQPAGARSRRENRSKSVSPCV
jgi:hypothetical protein